MTSTSADDDANLMILYLMPRQTVHQINTAVDVPDIMGAQVKVLPSNLQTLDWS